MPASSASVSSAAPCVNAENTASAQGAVRRRAGGSPRGVARSIVLGFS